METIYKIVVTKDGPKCVEIIGERLGTQTVDTPMRAELTFYRLVDGRIIVYVEEEQIQHIYETQQISVDEALSYGRYPPDYQTR